MTHKGSRQIFACRIILVFDFCSWTKTDKVGNLRIQAVTINFAAERRKEHGKSPWLTVFGFSLTLTYYTLTSNSSHDMSNAELFLILSSSRKITYFLFDSASPFPVYLEFTRRLLWLLLPHKMTVKTLGDLIPIHSVLDSRSSMECPPWNLFITFTSSPSLKTLYSTSTKFLPLSP